MWTDASNAAGAAEAATVTDAPAPEGAAGAAGDVTVTDALVGGEAADTGGADACTETAGEPEVGAAEVETEA